MSHYNKRLWAEGHRSPSVNPESRRKARIRHRYKIDAEEYDRMFAEQGGVCAICKRPPGVSTAKHWGDRLCVDHCHETGAVRGLLCNECNMAIGFGKTEEVLLAAAEYVRNRGRHGS
jgi:hypothetical protein